MRLTPSTPRASCAVIHSDEFDTGGASLLRPGGGPSDRLGPGLAEHPVRTALHPRLPGGAAGRLADHALDAAVERGEPVHAAVAGDSVAGHPDAPSVEQRGAHAQPLVVDLHPVL